MKRYALDWEIGVQFSCYTSQVLSRKCMNSSMKRSGEFECTKSGLCGSEEVGRQSCGTVSPFRPIRISGVGFSDGCGIHRSSRNRTACISPAAAGPNPCGVLPAQGGQVRHETPPPRESEFCAGRAAAVGGGAGPVVASAGRSADDHRGLVHDHDGGCGRRFKWKGLRCSRPSCK